MNRKYCAYKVVMLKNLGSKEKPDYVPVTVRGIIEDTCEKIGKIFRKHSELLPCVMISSEEYFPL